MAARITELRLTAFKSFRDVVVLLEPLSVLIGRNGSGKSNALDGLDVLHRLAVVGDVRDALEGMRSDDASVRGGVEGCAPFGSDAFQLGVRVERADGELVDLELRVQVRPDVQITWECLRIASDARAAADDDWTVLVETDPPEAGGADIEARVWNARPGRNPRRTFRATHLVAGQLRSRLPGDTPEELRVLGAAAELLGVLGGLFHFDPIPHLMRGYVPERDVVLRRRGENLSAAVAHLRNTDAAAFAALVEVVKHLPEQAVEGVEVRSGGFGEVMLGLVESEGTQTVTVPARQLSDGMLRMIAVLTALLGRAGVAVSPAVGALPTTASTPSTTVLLEELENGLHPTQAAVVLDVVARAAVERGLQVVITTHSPTLLNALPGEDHRGVVVVSRNPDTGLSEANRLVDLPGYHAVMATGGLGDVVSNGRLPSARATVATDTSELDRILGIG